MMAIQRRSNACADVDARHDDEVDVVDIDTDLGK